MHRLTKIQTAILLSFLVAVLTALPLGCNISGHDPEEHSHNEHAQEANHDDHDGQDHDAEEPEGEHEGHDEHDGQGESEEHAGHGHEGHGGEDMEKSVRELFEANCEHSMKAYQCDECRYEVGVVKVPESVIERGLIGVSKITSRDFDSEVGLTGEIQFDNQKIAHLGPRVPGVVRDVKVDIGQKVKAGQTLVILESVELAEAQASFLEALAEQNLAKKAYDRQKTLHAKKISSERDFLEAQMRYESAQIRTTSARQKLLRMGLYDGSVDYLAKAGHTAATGRLPVAAPFAGEILELHAVRGERVEPGADMLLVGDPSMLWVWVDLYESQLAAVKQSMTDQGLPVALTVRAWPGESFSGKVDFVGSMMDENTRTVKARVTLDNPQSKLKPGMFAKVALGLGSEVGRLAAPAQAVVSDEGKDFVFVHKEDDFYVRRAVTKGRIVDGFVELLDGVEAGQTIVIAGTFLLKSDVLRSKMGAGCAH